MTLGELQHNPIQNNCFLYLGRTSEVKWLPSKCVIFPPTHDQFRIYQHRFSEPQKPLNKHHKLFFSQNPDFELRNGKNGITKNTQIQSRTQMRVTRWGIIIGDLGRSVERPISGRLSCLDPTSLDDKSHRGNI